MVLLKRLIEILKSPKQKVKFLYNISNLATKTALTTVENKIPDVNSLVKKTNYNTKVAEIDTKLSSLDGKITKNESSKKELVNKIGYFYW